jgi:hypothetical protein
VKIRKAALHVKDILPRRNFVDKISDGDKIVDFEDHYSYASDGYKKALARKLRQHGAYSIDHS